MFQLLKQNELLFIVTNENVQRVESKDISPGTEFSRITDMRSVNNPLHKCIYAT
jgi:hypothetical protein